MPFKPKWSPTRPITASHRKNSTLRAQNEELRAQNEALRAQIEALRAQIEAQMEAQKQYAHAYVLESGANKNLSDELALEKKHSESWRDHARKLAPPETPDWDEYDQKAVAEAKETGRLPNFEEARKKREAAEEFTDALRQEELDDEKRAAESQSELLNPANMNPKELTLEEYQRMTPTSLLQIQHTFEEIDAILLSNHFQRVEGSRLFKMVVRFNGHLSWQMFTEFDVLLQKKNQNIYQSVRTGNFGFTTEEALEHGSVEITGGFRMLVKETTGRGFYRIVNLPVHGNTSMFVNESHPYGLSDARLFHMQTGSTVRLHARNFLKWGQNTLEKIDNLLEDPEPTVKAVKSAMKSTRMKLVGVGALVAGAAYMASGFMGGSKRKRRTRRR
jgi:hypothetical protein